MNKLAFSLVVLAAVGAGAGISAVGCTVTSTVSDGGIDSGSGDDSTAPQDSGTGGPDVLDNDTGTVVDSGTPVADTGPAGCMNDASLGVTFSDGGENTACEMCLGMPDKSGGGGGCATEQCECLSDTNMAPLDEDGGTMGPACGAYSACVYADFLTLAAANDAGMAGLLNALSQAKMDCMGTYASASTTLGAALFNCIAASCMSSCIPQ